MGQRSQLIAWTMAPISHARPLVGDTRAVAREHLTSLPAGEAHEVTLIATVGQMGMGEVMAKLVRMDTDGRRPAAAFHHLFNTAVGQSPVLNDLGLGDARRRAAVLGMQMSEKRTAEWSDVGEPARIQWSAANLSTIRLQSAWRSSSVVEQGTHKPLVGGSNPPSATNPLDELAAAVGRGAHALGIPTGASLLLAVSGGPDSMALLHGATRLADSRGWRLSVAHLDHGLRADSAADASFVTDAAAALGLACAARRTDVAELAAVDGRTIEEAGREARYRFLEEIAGADTLIATAHTADDSAETILLNLVRGSGLAGASGIPPQRGRVVRPLIGERRVTLRHALDEAGIEYRLDPSNEQLDAARNRVRHEVMPALERLNPAAVDALTRFGRLAAEDDALLDAIATAELAKRRTAEGRIDWHDPPARALGRRVLRLAIGDPAPRLERIDALLNAVEGTRGGVRIELGGGRSASVRERTISLQ